MKLIPAGSNQTMTSLDIAELVESRHDNVKRTIERLVSGGIIELPPMEEVKNHLGQTVSVYLVDERSSYIVVAQLSPEFLARIVDRWQKLEKQISIPQDLPGALRLAADQAEEIEKLENKAKADAPFVDFGKTIQKSPKSIKVGDYAKVISKPLGFVVGRNNFFKWLRSEKIVDDRRMP